MSSVNDVMKMAFFGPSSPEELDGLDLSALKAFEMRGNGWSVTLYDRGGDGQQPAPDAGQSLADAIDRAAARLGCVAADAPSGGDLTISGLSTGSANRLPAGDCPPWEDAEGAEIWGSEGVRG